MEWLQQSPTLILLAVVLVAFLESFALLGILVPGVVLLFSLAALGNTLGISPLWLLIAGAIGGCLGDISSYILGLKLSHRIDTFPWFRQHQNWLDQGRWFIRKWGWLSVIIGRFLGPLRPVVPLVAGTLDMPKKLFIPLNIVTVMAWAPAYLLPGYYTGELAELWRIQPLSTRSSLIHILSALSVCAGAIAIYHHTHPRRWHLRGWITQHQADHWPVGAIALMLMTGVVAGGLLIWPPEARDTLFQNWAITWQESRLAVLWLGAGHLTDLPFIMLIATLLNIWLVVHRRTRLFFLNAGLAAALGLICQLWLTRFLAVEQTYALIQLSLYTYFTGFLANLVASRMYSLHRWPIYALTSLIIVSGLFSQVLSGNLLLSEAVIAVVGALFVNGLLRTLWQSLGLPLYVPLPNSLIFLLMFSASAWISLQT